MEDDKTVESNVAAEETKDTTSVTATETEAVESQEQPSEEATPEQTVDIDGEKLTISEIKKLREEYANDSKWKDKNRRESEELNKQKERYRRLELLEPLVEQHPDKLLELLKPQQKQKDFDKELKEHYDKRQSLPIITAQDGQQYYDPRAVMEWEQQKDRLLSDRVKYESTMEAESRMRTERATEYNTQLEVDAKAKYIDGKKVESGEFEEMARWIVANLRPQNNGGFQKNAFDLAYKNLYEDRWLREIKLESTQKAVEPLKKSTVGGADNGKMKPKITPTPEDEADDDFVKAVRSRNRGKWLQT